MRIREKRYDRGSEEEGKNENKRNVMKRIRKRRCGNAHEKEGIEKGKRKKGWKTIKEIR